MRIATLFVSKQTSAWALDLKSWMRAEGQNAAAEGNPKVTFVFRASDRDPQRRLGRMALSGLRS